LVTSTSAGPVYGHEMGCGAGSFGASQEATEHAPVAMAVVGS
jgi:hypothetical protein